MAKTSLGRDSKAGEVFRLRSAGLSQRQIASQLGITRSMVQRILEKSGPDGSVGSDADESRFRADMREVIDLAAGDESLLRGYVKVEERFNAEHGLTGAERVQMATLALMMAEGALVNAG